MHCDVAHDALEANFSWCAQLFTEGYGNSSWESLKDRGVGLVFTSSEDA